MTLQLGWTHQFQFAGYYAAKAQGYYADAGLAVDLKEGGVNKSCYAIMVAGQAQYCADDGDNVFHYVKGAPIVALAAIFQHSPVTLITRGDSEYRTPRDLIGKRVELLHGGVQIPEIAAMFTREGISMDRLDGREDSFGIEALVTGKVDAMYGYMSNEPAQLDRLGLGYHLIQPRQYGIDFYGDALFTTRAELEDHPERAKAFRAASVKGWTYAMSHPAQVAQLIIDEYNPDISLEHLLYQADVIKTLIKSELVEVGHMNPARWRHMADLMDPSGTARTGAMVEDFIFDPDARPDYTNAIRALVVAVCLTVTGLAILGFFNARLAREVRQRKEAETRLALANEKLAHLSVTDELTGLANRRRFDEVMTREVARSNRTGQSLALVLIDIDLFKAFNDRYGHQSGDSCLRCVAGELAHSARRDGDLAARYGGEEFALVMPDAGVSASRQMAENFRQAVEELAIVHADSPYGTVTISAGVAVTSSAAGLDARALIELADNRLYQAKHDGRNRIVWSGPEAGHDSERPAEAGQLPASKLPRPAKT